MDSTSLVEVLVFCSDDLPGNHPQFYLLLEDQLTLLAEPTNYTTPGSTRVQFYLM